MRSPDPVYAALHAALVALDITSHRTAVAALTDRVAAVLTAQSLAPAEVARALRSDPTVPARQRLRRLTRSWRSPLLTSDHLTPRLVRAALLLAPSEHPLLALDSVRCGAWEIFTVGLVWHRRTLLLGWSVLPYPWPKGRFTPTVCALLDRVAAAWPQDAPTPELLADRGFPSGAFFRTLQRLGWAFTIRLRASDTVMVAGEGRSVRSLLSDAVPECWTRQAGSYGTAPGVPGQVVIGQGLLVLPWHQRDAGSARARRARAARREHDLHAKHPRRGPSQAAQTDPWVVLFSSHATALPAVGAYRYRWAAEGTYRDAQSGWDGRHGWNLEPTVAQATSSAQVERIVGLWALALLVQSWVGDQVGAAHAPAPVQAVVRQWTTSGRLSVFARGRLVFADRSGDLEAWLVRTLQAAAGRLIPPTVPPRASPLPQAA